MSDSPISDYELEYIARGFKFRKEKRNRQGVDEGWWYNEGAAQALDYMVKEVSRYFGQPVFECLCDEEDEDGMIDPACPLHNPQP